MASFDQSKFVRGRGVGESMFVLSFALLVGATTVYALGWAIDLWQRFDEFGGGTVFVALWWGVTTLAIVGIGSWAVYQTLRSGYLRQTSFLLASALMIVSLKTTAWQAEPTGYALSIRLSWGDFQLGINFVGILLLIWYLALTAGGTHESASV